MAVYFKISQDGKKVLVAKTLLEKDIDKEKFYKISKEIDLFDFTNKLSEEKAKKIIKVAEKAKKIYRIPITQYGKKVVNNNATNIIQTIYFVGDKVFCEDNGEKAKVFEKNDALKYAEEYYGKDFIKKFDLSKMESDEIIYVQGNKEIGFKKSVLEEFKRFQIEKEMLSSIISLNKLLKNDAGCR